MLFTDFLNLLLMFCFERSGNDNPDLEKRGIPNFKYKHVNNDKSLGVLNLPSHPYGFVHTPPALLRCPSFNPMSPSIFNLMDHICIYPQIIFCAAPFLCLKSKRVSGSAFRDRFVFVALGNTRLARDSHAHRHLPATKQRFCRFYIPLPLSPSAL